MDCGAAAQAQAQAVVCAPPQVQKCVPYKPASLSCFRAITISQAHNRFVLDDDNIVVGRTDGRAGLHCDSG